MASRPARRTAPPAAAPAAVASLGSRSCFSGEVSGTGELVIRGSLEGTVRLRGRVEVAVGGKLRRQVAVRELEVAGLAEGWLEVTGRIVARRGGTIRGTAAAGRWVVDDGARLELDEMKSGNASPRN